MSGLQFLWSPCAFSQILGRTCGGTRHYEAWFTDPESKTSRRIGVDFSLDRLVQEIDAERLRLKLKSDRANRATRKALGKPLTTR